MTHSQPEGFLAVPFTGKGRRVLVLHAWWGFWSHKVRVMDEIASILDKFIKLQLISKETIEEILSISLRLQSNSNPYWNFYEAICPGGPFAQVKYREPGNGATSQVRTVILSVRPELQVAESEVRSLYELGTIAQIIPEVQPGGEIVYKYEIDGQELFMAYSGQTYRLSRVTIQR